jgi:uncharacterized protein (DUF924 family)
MGKEYREPKTWSCLGKNGGASDNPWAMLHRGIISRFFAFPHRSAEL